MPTFIPASVVGMALVAMLAGCASDDDAAATTLPASPATVAATEPTPVETSAATVAATTVATTAPVASAPESSASTDESTTTAAPDTTLAPATTPATTPATAPATTPATASSNDIAIMVTAGVDSGEDRIESIPLGATVTLTVVNPDRDDEFHVHGYELGDGIEVPAGQPEIFTFVADQAGMFEVESHTTDVVLLVLNVG